MKWWLQWKNPEQIKNRLDQYKKRQINLTNIIKDYEIKIENKLKVINNSGGTNSKMFWNLIRQIKKSNSEDLYAIKNRNGEKIFNEKDIKQNRVLLQRTVFKKNIINIPQVLDWIHWKGNRKVTWK